MEAKLEAINIQEKILITKALVSAVSFVKDSCVSVNSRHVAQNTK